MIRAGCDGYTCGRENILKRLVVHSGAANLGLLKRMVFGKGAPRGLAAALPAMILSGEASMSPLRPARNAFRNFADWIFRAGMAQAISAAALK